MADPNLIVAIAALIVAVLAIPAVARASRLVAGLVAAAAIGAIIYFALPTAPDTGGGRSGPAGPGGIFGPSLTVSPGSATAGQGVTLSGHGFKPNSGVSFRYESQTGISYSISGFAAVGADGSFTTQSVLAAPACDESGRIQAYYGQSTDMTGGKWWGDTPEPVTATDVTVRCA